MRSCGWCATISAEGRADLAPVRTTKSTIEQIRNRSHWNSANLVPMDP